MSFPRYPKYKDSGVEWLGKVPHHWDVKPVKRNFRLVTEKAQHKTYPVALENIESWTGRYVQTESEFEGEGVSFSEGDILFGKLRPYLAKVFLTDTAGEAIGDFHVLRPVSNVKGNFGKYVLLSRDFINIVDGSTFGSKMPRASWEFVSTVKLAMPPNEEQTHIAAFLDRELSKSDSLISEQQRLINLLKEKRQAVISHAVTKGLNPDVRMKDSGIEWLGQVPEHWAASKISEIAEVHGGATPNRENPSFWDGAIPWASPKDMKTERLSVTEEFITEEGLKNSPCNLIPLRAVLIVVRSGILKHTLPVCINEFSLAINQDLKALVINEMKCLPEFFTRWIQGLNSVLLMNWRKQGATVESLEVSKIMKTLLHLPPLGEQKLIVYELNCALTKLDKLVKEVLLSTELLQERRTALISAAVTGQIDVRNLTHAEAA
jgi:type I restriction enzyme, S subunit